MSKLFLILNSFFSRISGRIPDIKKAGYPVQPYIEFCIIYIALRPGRREVRLLGRRQDYGQRKF